jgi:hypothetical protein
MAYEFANSAYTDTALSSYTDYLSSRIAALNAAPSISNASKALSLTKALNNATKSNISATIQRENIQVLSGNASLTDKYNVIANQFVRAQANGDMTLAQTLEGQAYSLSQTIQNQAQAASDARNTLAKANATSEGNIVTNLKSGLDQLNVTLQHTGQKDFNKVVNNWIAQNKATFDALGVNIPQGAQPNYWNVVNGVMGAMYNHDMLAYKALAPTDPQAAQAYADRATALFTGGSTVSTLAGNKTAQEVQQAMSNPSMFAYDQSTGKYIQSKQTGFQYTQTGIQPTYSGSVKQTVFLTPDQTTQMSKLGLSFTENKNGTTGNGVEVQASSTTPGWLKNILGKNGVTNVYATSTGLQFQADSISGQGKALYTINKDGTAWESSNLGDSKISGTGPALQQPPTSVFGKIGEAFMSGAKQFADMFQGTAYADALPTNMLNQATSHFTLPPLTIAKPVQLPTLSIAQPQHQTLAVAKPAPTIAPATAPTVNPQQAAGAHAVQSTSGGASLQGGGGFSLQ